MILFQLVQLMKKRSQGWHKLCIAFLNCSNTGFLRIGGSWCKSPRTNNLQTFVKKVFQKFLLISDVYEEA